MATILNSSFVHIFYTIQHTQKYPDSNSANNGSITYSLWRQTAKFSWKNVILKPVLRIKFNISIVTIRESRLTDRSVASGGLYSVD